jgi:lactate permease
VALTRTPEPAVYNLNWLSATGTGILIAALIFAVVIRMPLRRVVTTYGQTVVRMRHSLLTISAMLALGFKPVTRALMRRSG